MQFVVLTQFFRDLDLILADHGLVKQYYLIHTLSNLAIVGLTAPDVVTAFSMQIRSINWPAITLCYALHAYRIINHVNIFTDDDWRMVAGTTISSGPLVGCNLFFTGLPGAITSGLLFAEHNNLILNSTTKKWTARTNLWIFVPGCVATATLAKGIIGLLFAVATAINALYFAEKSIRTRYVNTLA
jgi:hypothetical protein